MGASVWVCVGFRACVRGVFASVDGVFDFSVGGVSRLFHDNKLVLGVGEIRYGDGVDFIFNLSDLVFGGACFGVDGDGISPANMRSSAPGGLSRRYEVARVLARVRSVPLHNHLSCLFRVVHLLVDFKQDSFYIARIKVFCPAKNKSMKKFLVIGLTLVLAVGVFLGAACPACKPANVNANTSAEMQITAKSAYLVEANSGKVLFAKDEHKRLPIASMVKIATLAVIYDVLETGQIKMGDMVTVSQEASGMGGSQAFLDFDSEYSVEELIKSIIVASANDSCVAMAELIAGSESEFVNKMNELGAKLGLENTNYVNCTGLPAPNAYSSAADVAKVYQYIMKSPYYGYKGNSAEPMNKVWMYDLTHPSGRVTGLTNTNRHARFFNGCEGGKTGFTAEAGHCIAVTATRGAMKPVAVIIGAGDSQTRFAESGNLMNFVFSGFENKLIVDATQILGDVKLKNAMRDAIEVYAKENYYDLVKKGDKDPQPQVTIELNKSAKAPLTRDTVLGTIVVTDEGKVVAEIDVVAGAEIEGLSYFDAVRKIAGKYKL